LRRPVGEYKKPDNNEPDNEPDNDPDNNDNDPDYYIP
jgi:hypothetical protein